MGCGSPHGHAHPCPPTQFRTLKPEEQRQALRSLELHYQAFLRDSQDAGGFGPEDRLQAEREYGSCSRHYQQLLQSLEQGRCGQPGGGGRLMGGRLRLGSVRAGCVPQVSRRSRAVSAASQSSKTSGYSWRLARRARCTACGCH